MNTKEALERALALIEFYKEYKKISEEMMELFKKKIALIENKNRCDGCSSYNVIGGIEMCTEDGRCLHEF